MFLLLAALIESEPSIAAGSAVRIRVTCDADGNLEAITVGDGQSKRRGEDSFDHFVKRVLPQPAAEVVITNGAETPYRCIGGLIYNLQRLGYRRVSFIAEPPTE